MSGTEVSDIRLGQDIETESLRIIDSEVPEPRAYAGGQWLVVRRMIHTTADFDLLDLVRFHPLAVEAGAGVVGQCAQGVEVIGLVEAQAVVQAQTFSGEGFF